MNDALADSLRDRIDHPEPPASAQFAIRNLAVLSYAQGFTSWHYRHRGLLSDVQPGFFDAAGDMMRPGDTIMVSAADGGELWFVQSCGKERPTVTRLMCGTAGAA